VLLQKPLLRIDVRSRRDRLVDPGDHGRSGTVGSKSKSGLLASVTFALIGAVLLVCEAKGKASALACIVTAVCVPFEVIRKCVDGVIAIDSGQQTKTGDSQPWLKLSPALEPMP
jgi:hypothetical protein